MIYLKYDGNVANSVEPDQMPYSVASDLGSQYLLKLVCPQTVG